MITYKDITNVLNAVIPLYVTMFLAYASVKWWKLFTPDQCSGINRFVAIFAIPLLSFEFISRINPFKLNYLFVAADAVSKILVLLLLLLWATFSQSTTASLDWCITAFSLTTLPNTLVMGIPLLKAMYGDNQEALMIQVVVLQSVIWYTLLLFLFELRAARNAFLVLAKVSDQTTNCSASASTSTSSSTKAEKNSDQDDQQSITNYAQEMSDQDEVVHVIVAKPMSSSSPDRLEQHRVVLQNSNKVAPDSSEDEEYGKELHMFVWRCACCSNSEGLCEHSVQVCSRRDEESGDGGQKELEECHEKREEQMENSIKSRVYCSCLSTKMVRSIMSMVWSKLIRNPNTYASLFGLIWALVSSKWNIKKPAVMENSVTILSNAGLGMAMFSLGLFMALQPRIIACGGKLAAYGMLMRFIAGPAFMAIASIVVGIRGKILKVSIVQAALPQGIVPFVFAREYNLHSEVLSTGVIFGMIISLPITILYYVLLGL